jgi:hypothetical protein
MMEALERVISATKKYVSEHNDQWTDTLFEYSLNLECIRTLTWHSLRVHCPLFARDLRDLVYVIYDERELIYIGQTEKSLVERISTHLQNPNSRMVGPWGLPEHNKGIEPRKIGYWLLKREKCGSINFWLSVFQTREVFGNDRRQSDMIVHSETQAFERYLIDKLCPLLNGNGTVEVLLSRYPRYLIWERWQAGLERLIVSEQCDICSSGSC